MLKTLQRHPGSTCAAVSRIEVEMVHPRPGVLRLRYLVRGGTRGVRLPAQTVPERRDELWRHTCFEAFLCVATGTAYYEFNFSPSGQWAAYEFDGYRRGMRPLNGVGEPRIEAQRYEEDFELRATLEFDGLTDSQPASPWRAGLSAVIEETDGNRSYWALAHPPGKPDFHHSDCFVFELPAAWRP